MMGGQATESNVNPSLSSPVATLAHSSDASKPAVILLAGLQGAGKAEFCHDMCIDRLDF